MNLIKISWNYLLSKPLNTFLNLLILALGLATIVILSILSVQFEEKIDSNSKKIDLVVGAKGSPLQLILCNIFHVDFPTGNIELAEAETLANNPLLKSAVPLALGDSYKSFRIVGSTPSYPAIYGCELAEGKFWEKELEVTAGAFVAKKLGLKIGDTFHSSHGIGQTSHSHEDDNFKVVGILKQSNTVIDNLLLCDIPSVWRVHETHEEHEEEVHEEGRHDEHGHETESHKGHDHEEDEAHHHGEEEYHHAEAVGKLGVPMEEDKQITSMLLKFKTPLAAIQLPRFINGQTNMQAASPAFETARLYSILGVGTDLIKGFAYIIVFIAILSIFIALYNALKERKYDLAIMRSLGCSKEKLVVMVLLEATMLTSLSVLFGLFLAHGVIETIAQTVEETGKIGLTGFVFIPEEIMVIAAAITIGLVTALIPAIQAYKTDISKVLAKG
ncbi:ABC transporter permease [Flammeovirgaceae bacterium SG7u.111]|nr:ABC transporter permease [Flammeovirgaceae bacterium SG7u.132]WPO38512.1 ABC transporter permease [Flammeovirgaceae bacterium SG7u.111]